MNRRRPGYTLLELMIVVILIGIVTAAAAPQIVQGMANNTVSEASNEVVTAFRAARTISAQQGRAMGIYVSKANRLIRVDRSDTNVCEDLPTCSIAYPSFGGDADCGVQWTSLNDPHFRRRRVEIDLAQIGATAYDPLVVCITPRGRVVRRSGENWVTAQAPIEIVVNRAGGGVPRRIIVNNMGLPRVML